MTAPAPSRRLLDAAVLADPLVSELLEARLVGMLATYDTGFIHAVPMWYAFEEDVVLLATSAQSRKARNLERDRRATLTVHDSRSGYDVCGASIAGAVDIVGSHEARPLVQRVHRRYLAAEAADDPSIAAFLESDDLALLLRPRSAITWDERGSDAAAAVRTRGWALPLLPTSPRA